MSLIDFEKDIWFLFSRYNISKFGSSTKIFLFLKKILF